MSSVATLIFSFITGIPYYPETTPSTKKHFTGHVFTSTDPCVGVRCKALLKHPIIYYVWTLIFLPLLSLKQCIAHHLQITGTRVKMERSGGGLGGRGDRRSPRNVPNGDVDMMRNVLYWVQV